VPEATPEIPLFNAHNKPLLLGELFLLHPHRQLLFGPVTLAAPHHAGETLNAESVTTDQSALACQIILEILNSSVVVANVLQIANARPSKFVKISSA
jgi:hypothetical protein